MKKVLIIGLTVKTGGGKSILSNYLKLLFNNHGENLFYILTPNKKDYDEYNCDKIKIIDICNMFKNTFFLPITNRFVLPLLIKKYKIDEILNLCDIPIPTKTNQTYLFDWPYAAYPNSEAWKRMDIRSYFYRKIKYYFFKRYIHNPQTILAQTATMKERLALLYGLNNIVIVPNAISLDHYKSKEEVKFDMPNDKVKLLCLTHYYPHKNIEIFIPLAHMIKQNKLFCVIIITIDKEQHTGAKKMLEMIEKENLGDIIINIGPIQMLDVPALFSQCDALLMPTLLESFSGVYVEAMYHGKPILTSNLGFARDVCGESAYYFNPTEPETIYKEIEKIIQYPEEARDKALCGKKRVEKFMTWKDVFKKIQQILNV